MFSCTTFKPKPKINNEMITTYQSNIHHDFNRKMPISTNYPNKVPFDIILGKGLSKSYNPG